MSEKQERRTSESTACVQKASRKLVRNRELQLTDSHLEEISQTLANDDTVGNFAGESKLTQKFKVEQRFLETLLKNLFILMSDKKLIELLHRSRPLPLLRGPHPNLFPLLPLHLREG